VNLPRCWSDLTSPDAARAYAALWDLAAAPDRAVPFLRRQMHPVAPLDEAGRQRVQQWLTDLDSDNFAARQRAAGELERLSDQAAPALRAALNCTPTPEARRQMERLLEEATGWTPHRLRVVRAIAVLEQADTPQARRLLQALAAGAPEVLQTHQATPAVDRLMKRPDRR
jgi:hypothetical protein